MTVGNSTVDGLFIDQPDAKFSVNYYKFFMLNDMLCGGNTLPPDWDPERFVRDQHLYFFDLSVGLASQIEWTKSPLKAGQMRAYFNFSRPTPVPITIFALILSDACIVLDKAGRVTKETT